MLWTDQIVLINQAYDALKESVYGALAPQTRLKPYLDSIKLVVDESGARFDTAPMVAMLEARKLESEGEAFNDLVDLSRYAAPTLAATNFRVPTDSPLRVGLTSPDVYVDGATSGSPRDDMYFGHWFSWMGSGLDSHWNHEKLIPSKCSIKDSQGDGRHFFDGEMRSHEIMHNPINIQRSLKSFLIFCVGVGFPTES